MNKVTVTLIMVAIILVGVSTANALQKKPINTVAPDQLIEDTQPSVASSFSNMAFLWWIPFEYWHVVFINDKTTSESDKKQFMELLKPYSLLVVCQADISDFGSFNFYNRDEIEKQLDITFKAKGGRLRKIAPLKDVPPDLQILLDMFKPIFSAALGNMGQNIHFFVLNDYNSSGVRNIDPYRFGMIELRLATRSGELMKSRLDLPLNSLYVPRKCPNGKDAHVTWVYCPWTGEKLPD